jgi:hypothetical protein
LYNYRSKIKEIAQEGFALVLFLVAIVAIFVTIFVAIIIIVIPVVAILGRTTGLRDRGAAVVGSGRAFNDLVKLPSIQPDATTLGTIVNFNTLSIRNLEFRTANGTFHGVGSFQRATGVQCNG